MPFDRSGFLAFALLGRFLVELTAAQLCQNTGLFAGALKTAQSCIEVFAFSNSDAGHQGLTITVVEKKRPARPALSGEY